MRWIVVAGVVLALGACAARKEQPPDPQETPRAWAELWDLDDFSRECALRAADELRSRFQLQPTEMRVLRLSKRFRGFYRATRIVELYTNTGAAPQTYRFSCQVNDAGVYQVSAY